MFKPSDPYWVEPFPNAANQVFMKKFALAQMNAYEYNSVGWLFWNFKTENHPLWSYLMGVQQGWLPCHLPIQQVLEDR